MLWLQLVEKPTDYSARQPHGFRLGCKHTAKLFTQYEQSFELKRTALFIIKKWKWIIFSFHFHWLCMFRTGPNEHGVETEESKPVRIHSNSLGAYPVVRTQWQYAPWKCLVSTASRLAKHIVFWLWRYKVVPYFIHVLRSPRFWSLPWANGPNIQFKWKLRYSPI